MDFLTFFTFLISLLGFVAAAAANPLQAREDNHATTISVTSTMSTGVSVLPAGAIPYGFGKILYNTTLHGRNHQFAGHGLDDVYTQVKTQYPDFNPQNATWNKLLYPDVTPDNNKDDAPSVSANNTHSKGIENRMVEGGIVQGGNWHAFCVPVPGQGWGGGAKSQDSHLALWHYQGDYNVVTIPARWCGMFSCWTDRFEINTIHFALTTSATDNGLFAMTTHSLS
ncbi:uncharacterized protein PAC_12462 [Phialocephala subalpina]|uniref:Uncharacterized protein n=1 Tax=Phialocephala subalpina TaxID=576137 RepID=A0A1L7XC29_9HELO|nr:uncharacterized protein PAC_12462 [Phialocephala subalpina]